MKSNGNGDGLQPVNTVAPAVETPSVSWDWSASHEEHFVQFYEQDDFILESLCRFVMTGFGAGETTIVVATDAHLQALDLRLRARSVDVNTVSTAGHYVTLSAEGTLAQLKDNGQLSSTNFNNVIGGTIRRTAASGRRLRVFGELVALLCEEGNFDGAVQLEGLWNQLRLQHPFALFCAYPMTRFNARGVGRSLTDVCNTHSRVIPTESFTSLVNPELQTRAIALLQQKAQRLETEVQARAKAEENLKLAKVELERQVADLSRLITSEQQARSQAETANRTKDEFLATVSHELRTPLNAIIGWIHMLRRSQLDSETKDRALETIERNAKSQAQLVEDILDVSRMISGKLRLHMGLVDTASVINAAIDAVQLAANSKGIELKVTLDPSARHVLGDANRLQQVVWNLLSNAIKFTDSGGQVNVSLERVESHMQINVSDTGQGISDEFLPYVFDQFRQADAGSTRRYGGLGLGLALVRHLVELHGGSVRAASDGEGQGATFSIELPLAASNVEAEKSLSAITKTTSSISSQDGCTGDVPLLVERRVLIVDDDADTLQMLTVMLADRKAEVQAARSAIEALEILAWFRPHVIVLDLAMPAEDGYSLIEKIRSHQATGVNSVPAVALTAQVRIEDRARALSAGFNMFVPKPVEADELLLAINNLADSTTFH